MVLTTVIGVIAFFLKRTLTQIEHRQTTAEAAMKAQVDVLKQEMGQRHDKIEGRVEKLEGRLNTTLQEMPTMYTLREDWLRSSAAIDRKLDKIMDILSGQKGRTDA